MARTYKNLFCFSAGAILTITGVAKILSAFGHARVLLVPNPLLGLQLGHLMMVVGVTELVVAMVCFFSRSIQLAVGSVSWFATSILFYRFGYVWMGYHKPCRCLGNLTDAIHVPPQAADNIMKVVLAYLLIGSYATFFWLWHQRKKESESAPA